MPKSESVRRSHARTPNPAPMPRARRRGYDFPPVFGLAIIVLIGWGFSVSSRLATAFLNRFTSADPDRFPGVPCCLPAAGRRGQWGPRGYVDGAGRLPSGRQLMHTCWRRQGNLQANVEADRLCNRDQPRERGARIDGPCVHRAAPAARIHPDDRREHVASYSPRSERAQAAQGVPQVS